MFPVTRCTQLHAGKLSVCTSTSVCEGEHLFIYSRDHKHTKASYLVPSYLYVHLLFYEIFITFVQSHVSFWHLMSFIWVLYLCYICLLAISIHSYLAFCLFLYCGSWKLEIIVYKFPFPPDPSYTVWVKQVRVRQKQWTLPLSSNIRKQMNGFNSESAISAGSPRFSCQPHPSGSVPHPSGTITVIAISW